MIDGCYRFSFDGDCRDAAQHILFHDFVGVPRVNVIVRWCSSGYINRLEWITCVEDAVSCCRRRFAVCMDLGQARAKNEAKTSQTGDGVGNRGVSTASQHRICGSLDDGIAIFARIINRVSWFYYNTCQTATRSAFANRFISVIYVLNGRKVMTCILKKLKKREDLTFLTFIESVRIQLASSTGSN